jgi:hypothetical protein
VASVSAPVRGQGGKIIAAISVSGPIERLTPVTGQAALRRGRLRRRKDHALLWRSSLSSASASPASPEPDPPASSPHTLTRLTRLSPLIVIMT